MDELKQFELVEVLSNNVTTKYTVLLGTIRGQNCVIKLSRLPLPEFKPGNLPINELSKLDTNECYSWGTGSFTENDTCYFDVIFPATPAHIAKFRVAPRHMITETPSIYEKVVVPYIEGQRGSQLDWVRGILYNGVEADRVLFRDEKFLLLPNSKWDQKNIDNLYLLGLVTCSDLASVRDLTSQHIQLLEHIRDTSLTVAYNKFGLTKSQVKVFFHYHPSYYHLHVHVVNIQLEFFDFGKSILLDNVIDMLQVRPMKECTLSYILSETHELYKLCQKFIADK